MIFPRFVMLNSEEFAKLKPMTDEEIKNALKELQDADSEEADHRTEDPDFQI